MSPSAQLFSEAGPLKAAEHYRSIFNAMLNGLAYCKVLTDGPPPHDFVYIEVNDAFVTLTGLKNVEGKRASQVIPGIREEDPWLLDLYSDVARTGQPRKFERYVKALGEWFAVSVYSPAKDHFVAVFDVTTKAKVADEAMRSSEALFRAAFENSSVGMALMSPVGRPLRLNRTLCDMLGYSYQELLKVNWRDVTHPADLEATAFQVARAVKDPEGGGRLEKRYIRKDGTVLWADVSTRVVLAGEAVQYFISSVIDITEAKRAQEALRESEHRFRQLANEIPVGIYQTGPGGDMQFVNPAWLKITGLSEDEAFGPDAGSAIHPEDFERVSRLWQGAVASGTAFSGEYRLRSRDGNETWVRGYGTAVRDRNGVVTSFVGALIDISEARRLQADLAQSARLATMGTLVAGVAHEINNPLAAEMADQGLALEVVHEVREHLRGNAPLDRVADGRALDGVVEALVDAKESSERISRIVKDLSLFGKSDAKRQRTRLMDIVDGAIRWLPTTVAVSTSVEVEDGGAPDVIASAGQIEQILVNLITNAAKATPEGQRGTVVVRVGPGQPGMARIEVIDHGTGIAPAIRDRIFDPFFTTRPTGPARGTGLGLAICQAITTAHHGTLTFESELGKGTTFRMELPVAPAEV